MTEERKSESIRVGGEFLEYLEYIQKRFKEEYDVNLTQVEVTNILVRRAKEVVLFK